MPAMKKGVRMKTIDPKNLEKHLTHLCHKIGVRLAGTEGELAAADYIAEQFQSTDTKLLRKPFRLWVAK